MNYLYGDSTPSKLTSNFLEFLRDALDFAVFVLQSDERIKAGKARILVLESEAAAETERLDRFIGVVADAILSGEKGTEGSATAQCASRLAELCASTQSSTQDAIQNQLASDIALINGEEAAARSACTAALGALLWPHLPPDSTSVRRIVLSRERIYEADVEGSAPFGLGWGFELAIGQDSIWASPLRLERIASPIEIRTPQVTGWISKEVKIKPLRIERHVVTKLESSGMVSHLSLRADPTFDSGLDLDVDMATGVVQATRVAPPDDASAGPFAIHPDDASIVLALVDKLRHDASTLEQSRLVHATFDQAEFRTVATFVPFVERLVAMLAPIVREISARSLTPTELVLRRALADDRREEFFMAKTTLSEKFAPLDPPLRAYFAPLALDEAPTREPSATNEADADRPVTRAEIASSKGPPSSKPAPRPPPPPPNPPGVAGAATAAATAAAATAASAAAATAPTVVATSSNASASIAPPSEGRNERFVEAVKKIVLVLKSGRTDEGYQQYADLLRAESFTQYRPDDQRQALKMLLLAKPPAIRTEPVKAAYHAAIDRIQELVDAHADPMDYEMLGVAQLQLDEKKAAATAFEVALKLERARNPTSDLVSNLERRLSQVG